jgi:lysyl-tRNA synthetase class I
MITIKDIEVELDRATAKFPTWPNDPFHALAILAEEVGELQKAVLQMAYETHLASVADVRKEAVQTVAMAIRWLVNFERGNYNFEQAPQLPDASPIGKFFDGAKEGRW